LESKSIKITKIDLIKFTIKYKFPTKIALGTSTSVNNLFLRIHTNSEYYGIGEACSSQMVSGNTQSSLFEIAKFLCEKLKGKNPLAIESRMTELNNYIVGNNQVRYAIDTALYDIIGKVLDLPLYSVLGGEKREIMTDYTIFIQDSIDKCLNQIEEALNKGFSAIKLKVGLDPNFDLQLIKTIRDELGFNFSLRLDANQGWDYPTALKMLTELQKYQIQFIEQPLPKYEYKNLVRLRNNISIPIIIDESLFDYHDAFKLASMGACDYFNMKLGKTGGINMAKKINSIAEAAGIKCMVGCFSDSRIGLSAAAHFATAFPNISFLDLDSALFYSEDPVEGGIQYNSEDNSKIIISENPGHGADIKKEFLEKQEIITI
jgi:L-alanine-DL-glutamate epimerase-like enolase superfamily enzyme